MSEPVVVSRIAIGRICAGRRALAIQPFAMLSRPIASLPRSSVPESVPGSATHDVTAWTFIPPPRGVRLTDCGLLITRVGGGVDLHRGNLVQPRDRRGPRSVLDGGGVDVTAERRACHLGRRVGWLAEEFAALERSSALTVEALPLWSEWARAAVPRNRPATGWRQRIRRRRGRGFRPCLPAGNARRLRW